MGEIVNLSRYRKQRDQIRRKTEAAEKRARFGRSKDETIQERDARERARRDLDAKKLDDPA